MKIISFSKKNMALAMAALCALTLLVAVNAAWPSIAGQASAGGRLLPVYRVRTDEKVVALTFDAAWGNEDTQQLIDTLAKYKATATFFLVGSWVDKYPESVKALSEAGHEIGNHSNTHPHFAKMSRDQMRENILACNEKVYSVVAKMPVVFRAPYGEYSNTLVETMSEVGMTCIQWDVDVSHIK